MSLLKSTFLFSTNVVRSLATGLSRATTPTTVMDPNDPNYIRHYPWTKHFRISNVRHHWPRPKETKRVLRHGWLTRMSTPGGRKVLMNRILKGRHVLSH